MNEFLCHADTWQMTMRRLARGSKATLMDLRSFSPANQGCQYELEQLLDLVDLRRVVFLTDDTTDQSFLEATLHRLWQNAAADSPNRAAARPTVRFFSAEGRSRRALKPLYQMLMASGS